MDKETTDVWAKVRETGWAGDARNGCKGRKEEKIFQKSVASRSGFVGHFIYLILCCGCRFCEFFFDWAEELRPFFSFILFSSSPWFCDGWTFLIVLTHRHGCFLPFLSALCFSISSIFGSQTCCWAQHKTNAKFARTVKTSTCAIATPSPRNGHPPSCRLKTTPSYHLRSSSFLTSLFAPLYSSSGATIDVLPFSSSLLFSPKTKDEKWC